MGHSLAVQYGGARRRMEACLWKKRKRRNIYSRGEKEEGREAGRERGWRTQKANLYRKN